MMVGSRYKCTSPKRLLRPAGVAPALYLPLERQVTELYLSSLGDTHACLLF
jgi:hypothetical protein